MIDPRVQVQPHGTIKNLARHQREKIEGKPDISRAGPNCRAQMSALSKRAQHRRARQIVEQAVAPYREAAPPTPTRASDEAARRGPSIAPRAHELQADQIRQRLKDEAGAIKRQLQLTRRSVAS